MPNTVTIRCNGSCWQDDVAPFLPILYGVARKRFGRSPDADDATQAAVLNFCKTLSRKWRKGAVVVLAFRYSMLCPSQGRMGTGEGAGSVHFNAAARKVAVIDAAPGCRHRPGFLRYTDRDFVTDVATYSRFAAAIVTHLLNGKTVTETARALNVNVRRVFRGIRSALRRVGYPVRV